MVLMLKGLEGPYKNRYFVLKGGMTIGRKAGDILLENDPMVSSLHGRIIGRDDGRFMLEDAGSQNQFLVSGKQVPKVDLNSGVIFQVGQSMFEVLAVNTEDVEKLSPEKSWKETIFSLLEKNHGMRLDLRPLSPCVRVDCLLGANADDSWFLGFGPRLFGPLSEDIEILEMNAADVAFEIRQGDYAPCLISKTNELFYNKSLIKLGEKVNLKDGDEIGLGVSLYKIRFIE
jgi:hypothetical protein